MGPLQVGTTLSHKYKIERLLAESGGTVLYEATDTSRAQRVWIKIMQRESLTDAAALARFQREAAGAKVLDVGKSEAGLPFLVATEFGPAEKRAMPPRPKASKTTLPGVAPPPARIEAEPSASALQLADADIVVEEEAPKPPPPKPATIPSPVLASPLVTTPPPKLEPIPEPEAAGPLVVEEPVIELPAPLPRRKPPSATPTIFIEGRQHGREEKSSQTPMWVAAILLVAAATGLTGWYFGRKDVHAPTTTTTTTTTTAVAAVTTQVAPLPTPSMLADTATASVTASALPSASVAPSVSVAPAPPPPRKPPRRPPVTTSHPVSGDPLTL